MTLAEIKVNQFCYVKAGEAQSGKNPFLLKITVQDRDVSQGAT